MNNGTCTLGLNFLVLSAGLIILKKSSIAFLVENVEVILLGSFSTGHSYSHQGQTNSSRSR